MSPSTSGPQRTAARCPRVRLSKATGRYPARASALQAWLPTYPAPPVPRPARDIRARPQSPPPATERQNRPASSSGLPRQWRRRPRRDGRPPRDERPRGKQVLGPVVDRDHIGLAGPPPRDQLARIGRMRLLLQQHIGCGTDLIGEQPVRPGIVIVEPRIFRRGLAGLPQRADAEAILDRDVIGAAREQHGQKRDREKGTHTGPISG